MQRLHKFVLGAALIGGSATIGTLMDPARVAGQIAPVPQPVEIVSPLPVPVQVRSLPDVYAQQRGSWTVSLTGTPGVSVSNNAATPLFVRDPIRTPFASVLSGVISPTSEADYAVPAGKQLVITDLQAIAVCKHGEHPYLAYSFLSNSLFVVRELAATTTEPSPLDKNKDTVSASQYVELYLNAHERFGCLVRSADYESVHGSFYCSFSGYTIERP